MKYLVKTEQVTVPKGVTVSVKARVVTCKGPRGTIHKDIKHLKVEIVNGTATVAGVKSDILTLNSYMTTYKQSALLCTVAKHIRNMIVGVTEVIY